MSSLLWWQSVPSLTPIAAWDAGRVDGATLLDGVGNNHITASKPLRVDVVENIGVSGDGEKMVFTTGVPIPAVGVVAGWWSPLTPTRLLGNAPFQPWGNVYQPRALKSPDHGIGNGWSEVNFGTHGDATTPVFAAMVTRGTDVIYYVNGERLGGAVDISNANWTVTMIGDHFGYDENLADNEYLHALGFWSGVATQNDIKALEAAARLTLAAPNKDSLSSNKVFGFAVANKYGKVLVSSETKTLHYIGKAALSEVVTSSGDCGGMYRWLYTIKCIDYPTPFLTANGGYTAVTSVRPGNDGWILEVISTKPGFVEVYIFAPARSATFVGTHGVRVLKRDGNVAFDSRGKPLSLMASQMVRPPSSVRYGAISGTPWFCRSMPNSTLTPDISNSFYPSNQGNRPITKAIFHYASIAQAEIEREFTTGRWGEGGYFDKREYQLWSTYWGFYRAGVNLEMLTGSFISAECGWVPVDTGCYAVRYESGRSIAGFNVGGGGTSSGGTWPFKNQTINLQPTLLLISDGSLYDEIGEVPAGLDDPKFRQGGGYGSWETMAGVPFYVHYTGTAHTFESPEAAFSDYLAKENAAALQRWSEAQSTIPEGYPNPPADSYTFTELKETSPLESIGFYVANTWQVLTDTAPDGTVSEPYSKMASEGASVGIGALQLDFVASSSNSNVPTVTRGTALAALAAHCAARWALGDCTDLWEILLVPAYDTTDVTSVPQYGAYLGSYKIRINGVESLVQNIVVGASFPMNMVFPPPMTPPP